MDRFRKTAFLTCAKLGRGKLVDIGHYHTQALSSTNTSSLLPALIIDLL